MSTRIKIFTFVTGHGETLVEPPHEDRINEWLQAVNGEMIQVTQSESERPGTGHHVTMCIWYTVEG